MINYLKNSFGRKQNWLEKEQISSDLQGLYV